MRTHCERKRNKEAEELLNIAELVGFTETKVINERVFQMINPKTGEKQQFHSVLEAITWMQRRWNKEV